MLPPQLSWQVSSRRTCSCYCGRRGAQGFLCPLGIRRRRGCLRTEVCCCSHTIVFRSTWDFESAVRFGPRGHCQYATTNLGNASSERSCQPNFFLRSSALHTCSCSQSLTAWFCQRWMLSSLRALFQCWNQILLRCQTSKGSRNSGRSTLASLSWDTDLKHFCSCPARRGGSRGPSPSMWLPIR